MADYVNITIYVFFASLVLYVIISIKKRHDSKVESAKISQLEKIAEYFSASSFENALRQIIQQQPDFSSNYAKIVQKIDGKMGIEDAIEEAASESRDKFFKEICPILIAANRKNDANILFQSVQKIKETAELQRTIDSKSGIGSFIVQFVFAIVMPLMYFFVLTTLGFQADAYLNVFMIAIVILAALFQGVVFRQWSIALIKVPMLISIFYLLFFVLAPKFIGGVLGTIV